MLFITGIISVDRFDTAHDAVLSHNEGPRWYQSFGLVSVNLAHSCIHGGWTIYGIDYTIFFLYTVFLLNDNY